MAKVYGGRQRRGVRPSHFSRGSGSVARRVLQALEGLKMVEKDQDGYVRVRSPESLAFPPDLFLRRRGFRMGCSLFPALSPGFCFPAPQHWPRFEPPTLLDRLGFPHRKPRFLPF